MFKYRAVEKRDARKGGETVEQSTANIWVNIYAIIAWIDALLLGVIGFALLSGSAWLGLGMIPWLGVFGAAISFLLIIVALFCLFLGIGLWKRQAWARIAMVVFSILSLFSFPLGTLIGVVGIWLFGFNDTVKGLFGVQAPTPAPAPAAPLPTAPPVNAPVAPAPAPAPTEQVIVMNETPVVAAAAPAAPMKKSAKKPAVKKAAGKKKPAKKAKKK